VKILGIDPGMTRTGYGIIECVKDEFKVLNFGCIKTNSQLDFALRLKKIYDELNEVMKDQNPHEVAVESVFFAKNAKLALSIGHARGVVLLLAVINNIPTFEYSVREVKQAVAGNGSASKDQVQRMVTQLFGLPEMPQFYDTSDALAVALCHGHRKSKFQT